METERFTSTLEDSYSKIEKEISKMNNRDFDSLCSNYNVATDDPFYGTLLASEKEKRESMKRVSDLEKELIKDRELSQKNDFFKELKKFRPQSLDDLAPYIINHVNFYGPVKGTIESFEGRYSAAGIPVERIYNFLGKTVKSTALIDVDDDNLEIMKENLEYYLKPYLVEVDGNSVTVKKK